MSSYFLFTALQLARARVPFLNSPALLQPVSAKHHTDNEKNRASRISAVDIDLEKLKICMRARPLPSCATMPPIHGNNQPPMG